MKATTICACGCGYVIPSRDDRGRPRRFVKGHSGGPRVGHEVSPETRLKIQETKLGPMNASWKGDEAGYGAIHRWLHRHYKKTGVCELCKRERFTEWANLFGNYERLREDFLELSVPCHRRYDRMRKRHTHLRIGEKNAS